MDQAHMSRFFTVIADAFKKRIQKANVKVMLMSPHETQGKSSPAPMALPKSNKFLEASAIRIVTPHVM
jgi:hypothetical protein